MALYGPAIKKLIPHGSEDPRIVPRAIILHIAVSEASTLFHYFNGPSGGVESHFYIRRSGVVEQYRDTNTQADANEAANGFAISIETQGMGAGTWDDPQMKAIKNLITFLASAHRNIPLVVIGDWDGSGVGFHVMFPGKWDTRGASCPGYDRQRQFWDEIAPWLGSSGGAQSVPFHIPEASYDTYYDPPVSRSVESIQTIVGVTADGFYGDNTERAVAKYQRQIGVSADGFWGPSTEAAHKEFTSDSGDRYYDPPVNRSVKSIQKIVKVAADGYYGKNTERAVAKYQKTLNVTADGLWGPSTEAAHRAKGKSGKIAVDGLMGPATIEALQEWVGATQDGIMGNRTEKALQRKLGVKADGIVGSGTIKALQRKVGADVDGIWGNGTTKALQKFLNKVL